MEQQNEISQILGNCEKNGTAPEYLDNVKPAGNVLPILMKENFPLGLKILFQYIPAFFKILSKNLRYAWFMFQRIIYFVFALLLPFILLFVFYPSVIKDIIKRFSEINSPSATFSFILEQMKFIGLGFLSYVFSRITAWFQITEPSSLNEFAEHRTKNTDIQIVTMGHTHNPGEYLFGNNCRFYNTGTWIPIIEISTADIREDKTFTYLHLNRDQHYRLIPANNGLLLRWNDNASRADSVVLIERK